MKIELAPRAPICGSCRLAVPFVGGYGSRTVTCFNRYCEAYGETADLPVEVLEVRSINTLRTWPADAL